MIDPSLKAYLPQAMRKIGRYYRITCDLVNAARSPGYTVFQRISIQPIEKPHFEMEFMAEHSVDFDQASQRVTGSSHQHLLNAYGSHSLLAARMKFQSRMSNCPVPWKVHAEIQLLLFYEQQPRGSRPRIIGSSKSACYLCDLFIHTHGEFRVPRTHGRLYDRWILPKEAASGHLLSVIDRFNAALEAKIKQTSRHRARPLPHPNESVLLLPQPWPSNSTLAETNEQVPIQVATSPVHEDLSSGQMKPPSHILPRSPSTPTTSISLDQPISQPDVENVQLDVQPSQPTEVIRHLSLGESTTLKLLTPQNTLIIDTGPARLHASWDPGTLNRLKESPTSPRACWIHVQLWSAGEDQAALDDDRAFESVEIDSLAEDQDTVVQGGAALSEKKLALRIRGCTIVVQYVFEDVEGGGEE